MLLEGTITNLLVGSLMFVPQWAPVYGMWDGRAEASQESTPAPEPEHTHPPAPTPQPEPSHSHAPAPTPQPEPQHTHPAEEPEPAPEPKPEHTHAPAPEPPPAPSGNATTWLSRYCPGGSTVVWDSPLLEGHQGSASMSPAMEIYVKSGMASARTHWTFAHECAHLWQYTEYPNSWWIEIPDYECDADRRARAAGAPSGAAHYC